MALTFYTFCKTGEHPLLSRLHRTSAKVPLPNLQCANNQQTSFVFYKKTYRFYAILIIYCKIYT